MKLKRQKRLIKVKKILWVFFFVAGYITLHLIVDTYGLLETKSNAGLTPEIGKWKIKINELDVTETNEIIFSDLDYDANDNVETGYFAPGTTGYYEIEIDASGSEVAIRYDISFDTSAIEDYPNILFSVTESSITPSDDGSLTYSGFLALDDVQSDEVITIKLKLEWEHDEAYNTSDSSLIGKSLSVPITIKFSQYLGEEI